MSVDKVTTVLERFGQDQDRAERRALTYRSMWPLGTYAVRRVPGALGTEWAVCQITEKYHAPV